MQISNLFVPSQSQTTGVSFGLSEKRDDTTIAFPEIAKNDQGNSTLGASVEATQVKVPYQDGGEIDPATHVAPPSIIQIKISQMLTEQAQQTEPAPDNAPENDVQTQAAETVETRPDTPQDVPADSAQDATDRTEENPPSKDRYAEAATFTQSPVTEPKVLDMQPI